MLQQMAPPPYYSVVAMLSPDTWILISFLIAVNIIATLEFLLIILGVNVAPKASYLCKLQLLAQNFFQCYLLVFHAVCGPEELLFVFVIAAMTTGDVTGLRSCLLSRVLSFNQVP